MKTNVAVFYGCRSVEHEVSIISAVQAMRAIDREKYDVTPVYVTKDGEMYTGSDLFTIEEYRNMPELLKKCKKVYLVKENRNVVMKYENAGLFSSKKPVNIDVAFPVVHGTNCEDGTIEGYFEYLGLPYVGCDIISSAVGMDKAIFKDVLKGAGLPVLDCVCFRAREYMTDKESITAEITEKIGFPLIVKPVNLGSSVGITKVNTIEELDDAITLALSFADRILVEHAVSAIREINCSVLGDTDSCTASVCEEPFMNDEILSYEDKYMGNSKNGGQSKGMASLGRKIPADLSEEKSKEIRDLACKIFKAIGASGVVRIDFIIDTETDTVYANEINTIPGSLAFYLWEASGIKYPELCDRLIELAFRRQRSRENLTFTIDTNILSGVSFGTKGSKGAKM
ncbi:MAG: D-alanine--D-alanine ligase family protein [Acutalibacteraceae bacterium]|nr:D-alanine--D-alanine ligase family protein [Acutalibacteraceae bacterium]